MSPSPAPRSTTHIEHYCVFSNVFSFHFFFYFRYSSCAGCTRYLFSWRKAIAGPGKCQAFQAFFLSTYSAFFVLFALENPPGLQSITIVLQFIRGKKKPKFVLFLAQIVYVLNLCNSRTRRVDGWVYFFLFYYMLKWPISLRSYSAWNAVPVCRRCAAINHQNEFLLLQIM